MCASFRLVPCFLSLVNEKIFIFCSSNPSPEREISGLKDLPYRAFLLLRQVIVMVFIIKILIEDYRSFCIVLYRYYQTLSQLIPHIH